MGAVSPAWIAAGLIAGLIAFAALKIVWGVALWAKRGAFRIGERWGDEVVEVTEWADGKGYVSAGGELWRAMSNDPLKSGDRVVVAKAKGLTLQVRKARDDDRMGARAAEIEGD